MPHLRFTSSSFPTHTVNDCWLFLIPLILGLSSLLLTNGLEEGGWGGIPPAFIEKPLRWLFIQTFSLLQCSLSSL